MATAVIVMAYGGPACLEDVPAFLKDVHGGREPGAELAVRAAERYKRIGGASPLPAITAAQAAALQARLAQTWGAGGGRPAVYVGMRHSKPGIRDAAAKALLDGNSRIVALPLVPLMSRMSASSYMGALEAAIKAEGGTPGVVQAKPWNLHPRFIEAWAAAVSIAIERLAGQAGQAGYGAPQEGPGAGTRVVFTAHSLPVAAVQGDSYPRVFEETAAKVAKAAAAASWRLAFQSRPASADAGGGWLGPDAGSVLEECAREGCRQVVVAPLGYVSDSLETLHDIDISMRALAQAVGVRLERAGPPNLTPGLIDALADAVLGAEAR